jgi:tetratricopeptide (TPR) repeat protein
MIFVADPKKIAYPCATLMRTAFAIFIGIFFLTGCASQKQPTSTASATTAPELKLGSHHFKVTTKSAAAQRAFDRGLTLTYSFAHFAAADEFRKATEADPQLAMAYWGIALVNGPHINFPMVPPDHAQKAWEALTKAQQFAPKASELEQDLVAALAKRYANPQPEDRSGLDRAYADAMRALWKKYPQNADVGALFAEAMMDLRPWDLWKSDGAPQPGTLEIVDALERALSLNPKHPGANHYYIHTMEASPHPEKALASARRLSKLVPDAGHMVHMPAHTYARVGDWDAAAQSNLDAMQADAKYRATYPRPGFYALYMAHNQHFFTWAAMMQGRSAEAIAHARAMGQAVPPEFLRDFGPVVDGFLAVVPETLMRFGRWEEILAEPKPPGDLPLSQALWRYTRVAALAGLGRINDARAEQKLFEEAAAKVPPEWTFGNNKATNLLAIARHVLDGEIAAKEGKYDDAVQHLSEGAKIEDGLRYDEPPDWMQPVRHTLGAVLLKAGKPAEAEAVYREDLKKYPENAWSLFGLREAERASGKTAEADTTDRRFQKAWAKADFKMAASCLCLK